MFWLVVAAAIVALVRYSHLDTYVMGLISLVDLLFSVKRRALRVQTKNPEWTMADTIEESCRKYWDHCLVEMAGHVDKVGGEKSKRQSSSLGKSRMTFGEAEMASSAVAKWMTTTTIRCQPDDIVAIFMPSGCEFVAAFFGLIRCGVHAALVNTGLRGNSLVHALTSALAEGSVNKESSQPPIKAVLVSPDLRPAVEALSEAGQLPSSIAIIECGPGCELDPWIETKRFAYLGRKQQQKNKTSRWDDTCCYIYTSGTTGFPKASKMNHMRLWSAGCVGKKVCRLRSSDRLYCPLPLYHSSGLTLGLGACLQRGCTTVIRSKFSVRHFSQDILTHRCTGVQYIGEMARYLVSAPLNTLDAKISLDFAWGNGMPTEVWKAFQKRYNIKLINEFYASTEGNVNIFNNTGMAAGACGIVPPGFGWIYPIGIFRYDMDSGELIREAKTGLCVPAGRNEPGELLGLIKQNDPSRRFDGYTNDTATRSKVVSDVCKPGDTYFRSGDLLRQDHFGFLYFCDRVGETFRWKGENVSTSEVARVLLACSYSNDDDVSITQEAAEGVDGRSFFVEAVVYGVEVPGNPGRAGMATAVLSQRRGAWQKSLWSSLQAELPRYAQPLFIRISTEIEKTATQKYKKKQLQDESFSNCGIDLVYFRDDAAKSFVLINDTIEDEILSGKRRV
jgi:acyl-CoA synthetase (AMP-forming)/AMP-acid ligase II